MMDAATYFCQGAVGFQDFLENLLIYSFLWHQPKQIMKEQEETSLLDIHYSSPIR